MSTPPNVNDQLDDSPGEPRVTKQDASDEINLLDLLIALAKHKKIIIGLPLLAALVAATYTSFLPPVYTASTTLFPAQGQSSMSNIMAQLGGLAALAPRGKDPNDIYVAMIRSRKIAD